MKKRIYFLHTIDGVPATYWPKAQICYVRIPRGSAKLARSLEQLKKEQTLSRAWRTKQGYPNDEDKYGYVRVKL